MAKDDFSDGSVKKGEPMWIGDKSSMVLLALLNAKMAAETGAMLLPSLPGDRDIYDYLRSGGTLAPKMHELGPQVTLPALDEALWEDIVAIRNNAESLAVLREVIRDAAQLQDDRSIPAIREKLTDVAAKIREDGSIWQTAKMPTVGLGVSTFLGSAVAIGAGSLAVGLATAGVVVAQFLGKVALAAYDPKRQQAAQTAELLMRISSKL